MKRALQTLLWLICAAHVVIGLGLNLSPGFAQQLAGLYGATVEWTPQFTYILKPLGAFMLTVGLLAGVAATNPVRYAAIVYGVATLLVLRCAQRVLFADEIFRAFEIPPVRTWTFLAFFLTLAVVLVVLCRGASPRATPTTG
jgi:hypothetical protein